MRTQIVHRLPRHYPAPLPTTEIMLAAPPVAPQAPTGVASLIPLLMPLFGMAGSVVIVIISRNLIFLIASGCMMVASIGGGILMLTMNRRTQRRTHRERQAQYRDYLQKQSTALATLAVQQREVARLLAPPPVALLDLAHDARRRWERRSADADFLDVRVGVATVPLCVPLRLEGADAALPPPPSPERQAALELVKSYHQLSDMPVRMPLQQGGILSICGATHHVRGLARALLAQLAVAHAPNDLRFTLFFPPETTPLWSWAKWLPHTRRLRDDKEATTTERLCLLAYQVNDMQAILTTQLLPLLEQRQREQRQAPNASEVARPLPHLVIMLDSVESATRLTEHPQIAPLLQLHGDLGLTIICLLSDRRHEPTQTQWRVECHPDGTATWRDLRYGGASQEAIHLDALTVAASEEIARALAPMTLANDGARFDMSDNVALLDLLHVPSPTTLRSSELWQSRATADLLRIPIGKTPTGETLLMDFKEAAEGGMGPHGLLIGATGSGKSELLRTIVTGLALTHDPTLVNFILADFKGGASFADFTSLPHVAGMITNLQSDLTLVDRMRAALFGEQERRQQLLRQAGNLENIRRYHQQRLYDATLPPLPYLFIIVDEFAELLTSRPDFLELFVAIGRVGRSLGMHLLLATQRLGEGRIEGLEGHLRYRICLRTFSTGESSSVIQTPDAFYLPPYPGVGYCKVDTTLYQLFKSALISSPLAAQDDDRHVPIVREFTAGGKLLRWDTSASTLAANPTKPPPSVMEVVIDRIHTTSADNYQVHLVWLPPLAKALALTDLLAGWQTQSLHVPVGVLDDPTNQQQGPLTLDFAGVNGHLALVGAPQSGKSTFVQTLIAAFMQTHAPGEVQIYAIDLGGGLLHHFEAAPHVGGICFKGERDKIRRMLRLMHTLIEERETFFRAQRIEGVATYRARRAAGEFSDQPYAPDIFLIVDDISQLQNDVEGSDVELAELAASGLTYGIHVIVTASRWADVRLKLRDNIGGRLELRLNDPVESEMGKVAAKVLLQAPAGRGIDKRGMQFQIALATDQAHASLTDLAIDARARWPDQVAPPLRLLPPLVTPDMVVAPVPPAPSTVMIGIDEFQLLPIGIDLVQAGPHFILLGDAEAGKTNLLRWWITRLQMQHTPAEARISIVDFRRTLLDCVESPHLFTYAGTTAMLKESVDQLKVALEERQLHGTQLTISDLRNTQRWQGPHHYLFIDDYDALNPVGINPLSPLLEAIQQARDVGFHVIVARRVGGIGRTATDPILQRLRELASPGLVMSGDPQEGPALGMQRAFPLPPGRGYLVRRHQRTTLVQTFFMPVAVTDQA